MSLNRRFLGVAGVTGLLIAVVTLFATLGGAASGPAAANAAIGNAAAAQYGPTNTGSATISGTAQEGSTLTANNGSWTSSSTVTYTYVWYRCDASGGNCAAISGASNSKYVPVSADSGKTLRVVVTASNTDGSSTSTSAQTAVVAAKGPSGPAGQVKLPDGKTSVPVTSLAPPYRLVVGSVKFSPATITSRQPIQMQVQITEASTGFVVSGVLVYVTAVPFGRITQPAEVQTNQEGVATISIQPTAKLPLQKGYLLTMFVRARKAGDNVLSGISSRRLVSLRIS